MDFLIALAPILVLITSIAGFRKSVVFSASLALSTIVLIALVWGNSLSMVTIAGLRGIFVATEIIVIVSSALLIVEIIKRQNLFEPLREMIRSISSDYRVHTILVGFALVYFIEGVAGFGTPAIVAVPILMALGFKPLHAVVLSLVGDTIPVSFGAVGLPVTYGVGSVVEVLAGDGSAITDAVINQVAALNVIASILLAVLLVGTSVFIKKGSKQEFLAYVPFAGVSGLIVSGFAYVTALVVGPELPSIIGGLLGVFVIAYIAKRRWLLPKTVITLDNQINPIASTEAPTQSKHVLIRALYPYVLLIVLLLLTRLPYLPLGDMLRSISVESQSLFGSGVAYAFQPLYSASTILLVTALTTLLIARKHLGKPSHLFATVTQKVARPYLALLLVLMFVQVFIYSVDVDSGLSMPAIIAQTISQLTGSMWPFFAPFIGALGSFLAGSATVSNLVFAGLQYDVAVSLSMTPATLLSIQTIGASAGNMIALHNIVAALTIAGISEDQTYKILKINMYPMLLLVMSVGLIGLIIT